MLKVSKYLTSILFSLIISFSFLLTPQVNAQTPIQSQMLTSAITVTDTSGFTIKGSIDLANNSTKGYDNNSLVVKLLQPAKAVETTLNGLKTTRTSQSLIIDYQKVGTVNLTPGQKNSQPFNLRYPATIESGDYLIVAELLDQDNSSQTSTNRYISLSGNGGFLVVNADSCTITVGSTSYHPTEGPTIQPNQRGVASCNVFNPGKAKVDARLSVPFAPFSVVENVGNLQMIETNSQLVSFEPNSERKISFILPTNLQPTVYEALMQLTDTYGQKVSANVPFRWIIPGESAKIANFDSNKSYYKNGEVARISANLLGSADTGWRGQGGEFSPDAGTDLNDSKAVVRITNDKGELCGEKIDNLPSTKDKPWDQFVFEVPIQKDCNNPTIEAKVLSNNDQVLDESTKATTSTDGDLKAAGITPPSEKAKQKAMLPWIIAGIVLIALVAGGIIFYLRRRKNDPPPTPSAGPSLPPQSTITTGLMLLLLTGAVFAGIKTNFIEMQISVPEANAQAAKVLPPNNSTNPTTRNSSMDTGPQSVANSKQIWSNIRDFAQNNTGGDSQITVEPSCAKISITVKGSTGSNHTCGNWGNGLPIMAYFDGQPIAVEGVDPKGSEKYQPIPIQPFASANNNFDILSRNTTSAQMEATFYVTPTQAQKTPGMHTLSIRAGTSYAIIHPPGMPLQEYGTTFGSQTTTHAQLINCDVNGGTCYMEIKHQFSCTPPKQCNEECASSQECSGQNGCNDCRDNGAGKKTCQPPAQCNANCTTNQDCASNLQGCKICRDNGQGQKTCQGPIQCNATCNTIEDCASNLQGCTNCRATPEGTKTCQGAPPQCNAQCSTDRECFGALNGCNACVEGSCQKPPACGSACTVDATCERATDGCTQCVSGSCRVPPACGTACTTKADCAGARDGCAECMEGTCTNFREEMCSCDGFEATQLEYPSSKPFSFTSYAKVIDGDIAKAMVEGIQFRLSESDKTNPNAGTIIAQSPMYPAELVEQSANKMRYKAVWNLTPPEIKKGKLYRVFSEIKCKPKRIVKVGDAKDPNQYQSKVAGISTVNAQVPNSSSLARDDLQLKTLNLIKKGETDKCKYLFFEYDEAFQ